MSEAELIFTALAELSTRQIYENIDAKGFKENQESVKKVAGLLKTQEWLLKIKQERKLSIAAIS